MTHFRYESVRYKLKSHVVFEGLSFSYMSGLVFSYFLMEHFVIGY